MWQTLTQNSWSITELTIRLAARLGVRRVVAESLVVALFLASASIVLEKQTGMLEWLDVGMLSVVPLSLTVPAGISRDVPSDILVVTISPQAFETQFGGQTPIPRQPFVTLLNDVVTTFRPAMLAVDYDLSPGCSDLTETTLHGRTAGVRAECGPALLRDPEGRRVLDDYLRSRPVDKLVLIRPLPVDDPALCDVRRAWETRLHDEAGVRFGESDLVHHGMFDTVVKFEQNPRSFARHVYCGALAGDGECAGDAAGHGARTTAAPSQGCETREQLKQRPVERGTLRPLNFRGAIKGVRGCVVERPSSLAECKERYGGRGFRVVFVGADYDLSDTFETTVGPKPGVTLHAYSAYSMKNPLSTHEWLAFLIEVAVGVVVGVFLHWTWGSYARSGPAERFVRAIASFLGVLAVGLALVLVAPLPMLLGLWVNPGPMLIGLFIKSWHTSLGAHHSSSLGGWDRVVRVGYGLVWIAVVGMCVFILVGELIGLH